MFFRTFWFWEDMVILLIQKLVFKCFNEIQKKIKKRRNFIFSLPIGKERVEFNAHRIFYAETVIENFPSLELKEFSCTAGG